MFHSTSITSVTSFLFPLLFLLSTVFEGICGRRYVPREYRSRGCLEQSLPCGMKPDKLFRQSIIYEDPNLQYEVTRDFWIRVPGSNINNKDGTDVHQLMIYFHGFMGNAVDVATKYEYNLMGRDSGTIMVYPEGMSDYVDNNGTQYFGYQGWNAVGSSESNQSDCNIDLDSCGYYSCQVLNRCAPCGFATCSNDTLFVSEMLKWLFENLCIDTTDVIATGLSNGALMTYQLITSMPHPFRAFIAVYGVPMEGYLNFCDPGIMGRPLLHIHGISDAWIPFNGSRSTINNVKFEATPSVIWEYAKAQGCSDRMRRWLTPWDTINNFTCNEYLDCPVQPSVVLCTYAGGHTYPPMIEETTFLFLRQVSEQLINTRSRAELKNNCNPITLSPFVILLITSFYYTINYL